MNDIEFEQIINRLNDNDPDLTEIKIELHFSDKTWLKRLVAALPRCKALKRLVLLGNFIGDEGVKAIAAVLPDCTELQSLNLSQNNISYVSVRALAAVLPECKRLQGLSLSGNLIKDVGANALAEVLPLCESLQALDFCDNHMGNDGAQAIAAVLPRCGKLQYLHLGGNDIGDAGMQAIAAALPRCKALQGLNVSWNRYGSEGAKALREAVQANYSVKKLLGLKIDAKKVLTDRARVLVAWSTFCLAGLEIEPSAHEPRNAIGQVCNNITSMLPAWCGLSTAKVYKNLSLAAVPDLEQLEEANRKYKCAALVFSVKTSHGDKQMMLPADVSTRVAEWFGVTNVRRFSI